MEQQRCPNCGNVLLQVIFNGSPALICENCMLKSGQAWPIDMEKCELCDTYYFKQKENLCQCRLINGKENEE